MAVETELRAMNEDAGEDDLNKGVWENLQFISEHMKPDMDSDFAARAGFTEANWRRIMRVTREADRRLNVARVDLILILVRDTYVEGADNRLLLTGRASLSRTFIAKLTAALHVEFPDVKLLHKVEDRFVGVTTTLLSAYLPCAGPMCSPVLPAWPTTGTKCPWMQRPCHFG